MATAVDVCNLGLSHIGARAQVSAISPPDGSIEAGLCARFYPLVRRELLEMAHWSFAAKRVALAQVTNESTVWAYAYAKPADCIKVRRILPLKLADSAVVAITVYQERFPDDVVDTIFTERGSSRFELEGDVVFANEPDAVMIYTRDIVDTNKFSPQFVIAAGMLMASYLAGPIIKGDAGASTAARWRQAASSYAASAASSDANQSSDGNEFMPSHMAVRG